jgi:hypothetical protein
MPTKKKAPSKREVIEPTKGDKRYVRRKDDGTFGKTVDRCVIGRGPEDESQKDGAERAGRSRRPKKKK